MRGVLSQSILAVVAHAGVDGTYGYAIAQRLEIEGLGKIKGGTLYPILNRLEEDGNVTSWWVGGKGGPGRKTFAITASGRTHLDHRTTQWKRFTERTTALMTQGSTK